VFVCLCTGATSHVITDAVANGACTSKQVAEACGAGTDCGRCRHTVRGIIESYYREHDLAHARPTAAAV